VAKRRRRSILYPSFGQNLRLSSWLQPIRVGEPKLSANLRARFRLSQKSVSHVQLSGSWFAGDTGGNRRPLIFNARLIHWFPDRRLLNDALKKRDWLLWWKCIQSTNRDVLIHHDRARSHASHRYSEIRARVGRFNFWSPAAMKFLGSHTRWKTFKAKIDELFMFESTLPRRIESADAVAFRDFFQGTKKVDLFFFSPRRRDCSFLCSRSAFWLAQSRAARVDPIVSGLNENTIDQWETRSSSFKSGDCSGTLVCETSLFYWQSETRSLADPTPTSIKRRREEAR